MATSGYSQTALIKKLGIKPGMKICLLNEPDNYEALLGEPLGKQLCKQDEYPDLVHLFARNSAVFYTAMQALEPLILQNPRIILWVSWYKKAAKIPTDITEDLIRHYALQHGLVDIKVCAVNEQWSALKLVVPLRKR